MKRSVFLVSLLVALSLLLSACGGGTAALIYSVLVFAVNRGLDTLSKRTRLPTHP